MAIEPIKGFYVHDEVTNTDGVAGIDGSAVYGDIFKNTTSFSLLDVECERGAYLADGSKSTNNTQANSPRARTVRGIMMKKGDYLINNGPGVIGIIYQDFTGLNTSISDSGWQSPGYKFTAPLDGVAKITLRTSDGYSFPDEYIDTLRAGVIGNVKYFNKVFTEYGRPVNQFVAETLNLDKEGLTTFDASLFEGGTLNNGVINTAYKYRVATPNTLVFDYDLDLQADTGYKFDIHSFNNNDEFVSASGWKTEYTVPAGQRFKILIGKDTETASNCFTGIEWVLSSHVKFKTKLGYEVQRLSGAGIYSYTNNTGALNTKRQSYNVEQMSVESTPVADIADVNANQGMTIFGGVIFQLYSNDKVELIDLDTGSSIAVLSITSDHGDTIDFSNEYYADGDEFPLAYITADTTPAKVYVNRITRTGCTLVKTYTFPTDKTGYYAGHALDPVNKILYQIGYTENSYYQDPNGTNFLIVSVWDLKNVTDNGNDTYTPAFMRSFKLPFYTTLQGQAFFNGLIVAVSSHWENAETKVLFIDPGKEAITTLLDDFPSSVKNVECEGPAFVANGDKYDMIIKTNNTYYYRVQFS